LMNIIIEWSMNLIMVVKQRTVL